MRRQLAAILVVSGVFAAAQAPAESARNQAWRDDVAFFAREFPGRQLDFAKLYPRERFDREINAITRAIPTATDADLVLALMRLVASAHVGHTYARAPTDGPLAFHRLPLDFNGLPTDSRSLLQPSRIAPRSACASRRSGRSRPKGSRP